jgi:hypothetical protein
VKQIYLASNRIEADLVCQELRGRGFKAVVIGDLAAIPSAPFPSVWVPDQEAAAAAVTWADLRGDQPGESGPR